MLEGMLLHSFMNTSMTYKMDVARRTMNVYIYYTESRFVIKWTIFSIVHAIDALIKSIKTDLWKSRVQEYLAKIKHKWEKTLVAPLTDQLWGAFITSRSDEHSTIHDGGKYWTDLVNCALMYFGKTVAFKISCFTRDLYSHASRALSYYMIK